MHEVLLCKCRRSSVCYRNTNRKNLKYKRVKLPSEGDIKPVPAESTYKIVAPMIQTVDISIVDISINRTAMLKTLHVRTSAFLALVSFMGLLSMESWVSILPVQMQRCIVHVIMGHRVIAEG